MKALLINPPTGIFIREDRCQSAAFTFALPVVRPPMDLMMMAASLEAIGVDCKIKDYPLEGGGWSALEDHLYHFKPDYLIVSTTTSTLRDDLASCAKAKVHNKNIITIAKGADLSITAIEMLREFKDLDIVITGECELAIKDIVMMRDRLAAVPGIAYKNNNTVVRNADREFIEALDSLPRPARHLIRNNLYTRLDTGTPMALIEISRGCPHTCIFCLAGKTYGHKVRYRSVKSVIEEIIVCKGTYNIYDFHLKSDIFTWDKKWVKELCQAIAHNNMKINWLCNSRVDTLDADCLSAMKHAGCWAVSLGVESGNQDILNKMKKGITLEQSREAVRLCKMAGIKTYLYFLFGFPWDTEETIGDSVRFAKELDGDFVDFFIVYPFCGTELEAIARRYNLLNTYNNFKDAYSGIAIDTLFVSKQKLQYLRKKALKDFYTRPRYILRSLHNAGSFKKQLNYLKYGLKLLRTII